MSTAGTIVSILFCLAALGLWGGLHWFLLFRPEESNYPGYARRCGIAMVLGEVVAIMEVVGGPAWLATVQGILIVAALGTFVSGFTADD